MYGSRGRVGLVVPSSNTTMEPELSGRLPDGVSLHTARMPLEDVTAERLTEMEAEADRAARLLATADVDVAAYGCTTGSLVQGPGYEAEIESRLSEILGAPTVATAASIKRAFEALDLRRLAIATPYTEAINEDERAFLEAAGYEVVAMDGSGLAANLDIGRCGPAEVDQQVRALDLEGADGVFVSCTNYRTFEVVEGLEADLGLPVVTSNQATLWDVLRSLDVDAGSAVPGRLGDL